MSQATSAVQRPGTITLIVVLMWINAILEIIGGVLLIIASRSKDFVTGVQEGAAPTFTSSQVTASTLLWAGIISILFGIITILLATGLKNGNNGVRIFVTILIVIQILADAAEMTVWQNRSVWTGLISILIWLIVLAMLWSSRASAFFQQREA
jgi:hypothetical protein